MAPTRSTKPPAANTPRPSRRIPPETAGKLPELAGCPRCGASYRNGRWTWKTAPAGSYESVCPACERIKSNYPAGALRVTGDFATSHRDEVIRLLCNIEARERTEHPLKRIMAVTDEGAGFVVTTTDSKLAETFGRALKKTYEGRLDQPPTTNDKENLVRVEWARD